MNSYRNLKKLFKEDLVFFNKVDKKYTVRIRENQKLIAEFFPIESYPKFMLLNKSPYVLKISKHKENYLKYLNIEKDSLEELNRFIELNIYLNEFNKELIELKIIDLKLSDIVVDTRINFDFNYKDINNIKFYISKIVNDFEKGLDYDFIEVVYSFKDNQLYIDGVITNKKDINEIILKYKKDFKDRLNEYLDYKTNKAKGFVNGY